MRLQFHAHHLFNHSRIREKGVPTKQIGVDILSKLSTDKCLFVQCMKPVLQGNSYLVIAQCSHIRLFNLPVVYSMVPQHLYGPAAGVKLPT